MAEAGAGPYEVVRIPLRYPSGTVREARVAIFLVPSDRPQHPDWVLYLSAPDIAETGRGADAFEALRALRAALNAGDLWLLCYGANPNVWPSGMGRSMSAGRRAYRFRPRARELELVDIFASGPGVQPVTVAEQEAFIRTHIFG